MSSFTGRSGYHVPSLCLYIHVQCTHTYALHNLASSSLIKLRKLLMEHHRLQLVSMSNCLDGEAMGTTVPLVVVIGVTLIIAWLMYLLLKRNVSGCR